MNKLDDDHFVLGSYNQVGVWSRKSKDCQVHKLDQGGIWAYREVGGYQVVVPDSNNVCLVKDGKVALDFGNSVKATYIKGHHNMGRNVFLTDSHLYFVCKKRHRLLHIDLQQAISQAAAGESHSKDQEIG